MKRYRNVVVLLILTLALSVSVGCTKEIKNTALTSYEMGGVALEESHKTAKKMCDAKQISGKNCNQMVKIYQKAQASFQLAGDALILAGRATDSVVQKQYTDLYTSHMQDAVALANEISNLIKGVK